MLFPNDEMSEFPNNYRISIGKYRKFLGSALTYRFRFDKNSCNPACLGMYKFS